MQPEFSGLEICILLLSIVAFLYFCYVSIFPPDNRAYPGAFGYQHLPPPPQPARIGFIRPNQNGRRFNGFENRRRNNVQQQQQTYMNSTHRPAHKNGKMINSPPHDLRMVQQVEGYCRVQKRMPPDSRYHWVNPNIGEKQMHNQPPKVTPPPLGPKNINEEPQFFQNTGYKKINQSNGRLSPPNLLSQHLPPPSSIVQTSSASRVLNLEPRLEKLFRTQARPVLGLDCEMVGVGTEGKKHALARVSIVDKGGKVIYDSYVRPHAQVTDYRTFVSGIEEHHLKNAPPFSKVRMEVVRLVSKSILVGHGLENDLKILRLEHPPHFIRDTAYYEPVRKLVAMTRCPPLKLLVERVLEDATFQKGAHDPREDAFAPVRIYLKFREEWDREICSASWENNR